MASAHDVAAYILREKGEMSTWKLQKLLYYSQAWQLAWEDVPLFENTIEAWANGPVVRDVYVSHRGQFVVKLEGWNGDPDALAQTERDTVDAVLSSYGELTGRQLSHLTHTERPWAEAREGLSPTDRSSTPISLDVMKDYYSALDADQNAKPIEELDWEPSF